MKRGKGGPPGEIVLRRTFPSKKKPIGKGPACKKKASGGQIEKKENSKDFLTSIYKKCGWPLTDEIRKSLYRKCYILLHGIARVNEKDVIWSEKKKDHVFFSRVSLPNVKVEINQSNAGTELEARFLACYSFFKFLMATCGLCDRLLFFRVFHKSSEGDLGKMALLLSQLLNAFSRAFGNKIGCNGRSVILSDKQAIFDSVKASVAIGLNCLLDEMSHSEPQSGGRVDLASSLAKVYYEVDVERTQKEKEKEKGTPKKTVFESSDEEENNEDALSQVSSTGATFHVGDERIGNTPKRIKREIKEDVVEAKVVKEENTVSDNEEAKAERKRKRKEEKERRKSESVLDGNWMEKKVKIEKESDEEEEKKKKRVEKKPQEIKGEESHNGWEGADKMEAEEEEDTALPSTYSNSMSTQFRSNLIKLAEQSWQENVKMFNVCNAPSLSKRFSMARFIIEYLEGKLEGEVMEAVQCFSYYSFTPDLLKQKEDTIGLLLYLDQRRLIGEHFFFLCMAMSDKKRVGAALEAGEKSCSLNLSAARLERSFSLGATVGEELKLARREATAARAALENNQYHLLFSGLVDQSVMRQLNAKKKKTDSGAKMEYLKMTPFKSAFWSLSARRYNLPSDWSLYEVNEAAVRVFGALDGMFEGELVGLIKLMTGCRSHEVAFDDATTDRPLTALYHMRNVDFIHNHLLFLLLRVKNKKALNGVLNALSPLRTPFKKLVNAGVASLSIKDDTHFKKLKTNFSVRAKKVSKRCIELYKGAVKKERKRNRDAMKMLEREREENENEEPMKKKRRKEEEAMEREEEEESEKEEEERAISPEIEEIEVKKIPVKVEEISDDEEEKKKERAKVRDGKENEKSRKNAECAESGEPGWRTRGASSEGQESNDVSRWIKMEVLTNHGDGETKEGEKEQTDLLQFRSILSTLCIGYWSYCQYKLKITNNPSEEDKFTISRRIIRFMEEKFGDEFYTMLFNKTSIKFTLSDLQSKKEVIGLVLYLDRLKLAAHYFALLIALNDENQCESILAKCLSSCSLTMELIKLQRRSSLGELVRRDISNIMKSISSVRTEMEREVRALFGSVLEMEVVTSYGKKMDSMYVDGNWSKYSSAFNIPSEWSIREVCQNAVTVFHRVEILFGEELIQRIMYIYPTVSFKRISEASSRNALLAMMKLNGMKCFPDGLVFLLLRNLDDVLLNRVCGRLAPLVPAYLDFINHFNPKTEMTKERKAESLSLMHHPSAIECVQMLRDGIARSEADAVSSAALPPLTSTAQGAKPLAASLWESDSEMMVMNVWKRPAALQEWQRSNEGNLSRLTERMHQFMYATVTRDRHYEEKMKVFEYLKNVLREVLSETGSMLTFTGSSLTNLSAFNSNLDIFVQNGHGRIDQCALVQILEGTSGITIVANNGKGSFPVVVEGDWNGMERGKMEVSFHLHPGTFYMSSVYQMVDGQDVRVAPLALLLKAWRILDPTCVSVKLRSYHIITMLIHFLQCGVSPPILPSLTRYYPELDPTKFRVPTTPKARPVRSDNSQSIASIIYEFFMYFSDFAFESYVISIRDGTLIKRSELGLGPSSTLSIEHPYTASSQARTKSISSEIDGMALRAACKRVRHSIETSFRVPFVSNL